MNYISKYDIFCALSMPSVTKEGSVKLAKAVNAGDKNAIGEFLAHVNSRMALFSKALTGEPFKPEVQTVFDTRFGHVRKNFETVDSVTSRVVNTHDVLFSRFTIDEGWMEFMQMIPAFGENRLEITQITNKVVFDDYKDSETIQPVPFGDNDVEYMYPARKGAALNFLNRWLRTNGRYNLNDAIQRFMIASMKKKANDVYTSLADQTGVTVQAFNTNIITTVNDAADALLIALDANDPQYDVTDNTGLLLLSNSSNKVSVRAAFRTIAYDDRANTILEYNVGQRFTRNSNFDANLGQGHPAGMLCLPGEDNIFAQFEPVKIGRRDAPQEDSLLLVAQEYQNHQVKAIQKIIVSYQ